MPKGDYYFKLYYQRLLTSTVGWKDDEFGAYMRLLIYQFDKGSIPSEINQIARIAPSAKKHWPLLSQKFVPDGNGGLVNKVMDEVSNERQAKGEANRKNGVTGGRPVEVKSGQKRFYLIECFNKDERFYKAGTTDKTVKARYSSTNGSNSAIPYFFEILVDTICDYKLGLELERKLRESFPRYEPKLKFGGHTECYAADAAVLKFITQTLTQNNPNGSENKSNTNVSTGILVIGSGKERGGGEEKPLGSDAVSTFANEAWQDQKWRENMMMGLNIKNEDTFKRWMAQFNASVANDPFPDFSTSKYKKLSRGWIAKQIERGAQIPEGSHIQTSTRLPQKI
jgi:uncharacterized protein YdaU (DUF1376 family)